jgi:hypothetical protein
MNAPEQLPLLARLDLIYSNPLTRALKRYDTDTALAQALECNPFLHGAPDVSYDRRLPLVEAVKSVVAVTLPMLAAARGLHDALFASLDRQNPFDAMNRRRLYEFSDYIGKPLGAIPWSPEFAGGLVLAGWTGTGKSHTVERFLSLVPQVVLHNEDDSQGCGWKILRQLVWVKVAMPHDGSRGGLIAGMFLEIDLALGTTYATQFAGRSCTVEKQLVALIYILMLHRCGLVVIEEAQAATLATTSRFGAEFVQFFLRLLNVGVAVAVVGNPSAFDELRSNAQTQARLTEYGWYDFAPITDALGEDWRLDVVSGIWLRAQLLNERDEDFDGRDQLLLELSGGILRYLARLRRATLALGLRTGAQRVTSKLILAAWSSREMAGVRDQIEALRRRDPAALARWTDLPMHLVRAAWQAQEASAGEPAEASEMPPTNTGVPISEGAPKAKRATSPRNRAVKSAAPRAEGDAGGYLGEDFKNGLLAELKRRGMGAAG